MWAVIELAGYEGENVRRYGIKTYLEACKIIEQLYPDEDKREELHVDIARENSDGGYHYDY